jgi:hypothetical protein
MHQARSRWPWPAAFFAALIVAAAASAQTADQPRKIAITGTPLVSFDNREPTRMRFGSLEFRGGLQLTSTEEVFGGLSGLLVARDGASFVAISDRGQWFRGTLTYRDGRLAALTDVETAPIRGPDGAAYSSRARFDSESLTEYAGKYCVGVERQNEIVCFDFAKQGLLARAQSIQVPAVVKIFPNNHGLEALVGVPAGQELAGALVAISERSLDSEGNIVAVMIGGPRPGSFSIKRTENYDVSDVALMPNGDLLLLERHFSLLRGIGVRIRRLMQRDVRPGAVVDGEILIEADLGYQLDNMEGIAVHRSPTGETIITLVSDDNFSALQRTLLLQFALAE